MGFTRRTYKLVFDGVYEGLEVRTRGADIGEYVRTKAITQLGTALLDGDHEDDRTELLATLAGKLLGWNLVDDQGEPVPCTAEQLAKEDLSMVLDITSAWLQAGWAVSPPLAGSSADGQLLEVPELPMEAL